jgi:hypothetical protein
MCVLLKMRLHKLADSGSTLAIVALEDTRIELGFQRSKAECSACGRDDIEYFVCEGHAEYDEDFCVDCLVHDQMLDGDWNTLDHEPSDFADGVCTCEPEPLRKMRRREVSDRSGGDEESSTSVVE